MTEGDQTLGPTQPSSFVPKSVDVLVCFCSPDLAYSYVEAKFLRDLYKPRRFFIYNNLLDFDFHFQVYNLYHYLWQIVSSDESVLIWFAAHGSADGHLAINNTGIPRVPEFSDEYRREIQSIMPATLEKVGRNVSTWSLVQYGMFVKAFVNFFLEGQSRERFKGECNVYFNTCMSPSLLDSIYEIVVDTLMMSGPEKIIRLNLVCYKENTVIEDKDNDLMQRLKALGMKPAPIPKSQFIRTILEQRQLKSPADFKQMKKYLDRVQAATKGALLQRRLNKATAGSIEIKQWPSDDEWTTYEESGPLIRRSIVY
ncbi:MAG: hypothetical protein R3C30_11735 [Hyphomonadaceae bacterium]